MGTVDVRRDQVEEWVLPTPLTTLGEALVIVSSFWTEPETPLVEVSVMGSANAPLIAAAPASVSGLLAEAVIDPFGSVFAGPLALASATVEFDNTASTISGVALRPAIAVIGIVALAEPVLQVTGVAGVSIALTSQVAVPVTADAEIEFAYYGDGNFPVFPYSLPALFTDFTNVKNAVALVEPTGIGVLDAVSCSADAVLTITGDTVLTPKGSTPILPWFFPVVFDDIPANVNVGLARLLLDMDSESVVALEGGSTVVIDAPASSLPSAVFPWTFPVILIGAA